MRHALLLTRLTAKPTHPLRLLVTVCRPHHFKMSTAASGRTYEDAIDALNTFQTPFAVIEARRKAGIRPDEASVREMKAYWARLGHTPEDLDRLNVVHVAGTKGKGSVCAFVASILGRYHRRQAAGNEKLKVGLLTSPHLVAVRERIRVGATPLSEAAFARYFFEVSDALTTGPHASSLLPQDAEPGSRPIYARYLTLMALHVFLREGVDVAVLETGVGGEYDATNIVPHPVATGISTLGIDHVFVLGDTVDKIAWHKAGIIKAGPATANFAVEQPAFPSTEEVLRRRAGEKGAGLEILGVDHRLAASGVQVRPDAAFQKRNASLAVALAEAALRKVDPEGFRRDENSLPAEFKEGIEQVVWRGRCEVKEEEGGRLRWHIDGAHTTDSLKMAGRWFAGANEGRRGPRILIFNQQGRTEAIDFLEGLHAGAKREDGSSFDHVVFCTNVTHAATGYKRDFVNHQYDPEAIQKLTVQRTFAEKWATLDPKAKITVIPSIEEALNVARDLTGSLKEGEAVQAFITGSLHLVGGALGILEGADAL